MASTPHIVTEEGHWFLNSRHGSQEENGNDREYEVDYRYAICYSLLNYLRPSKNGEIENPVGPLLETPVREDGKKVLLQLRDAIGKEECWQKDDFLKAVFFEYEHNGSSETGYVIIDEANGMYPLVLDSGTYGRLSAYQRALEDVSALYENEVYPLLKSHTVNDWNQAFQEKVSGISWNYAEKKEAVSAIGA